MDLEMVSDGRGGIGDHDFELWVVGWGGGGGVASVRT